MEDSNVEIESGKELSPDKQIILECWRRCAEAESKELTSGYWNIKFDKLGNAHKVWIPDTRKILINCIKAFDRSISKSSKDKPFKDAKEKIRKECDECFKRFGFPLFKVKRVKYKDPESGYDRWKYEKEYTGEYSMPEISPSEDRAIIPSINKYGKSIMLDWTDNFQNHQEELVLLYGKLQEELISLLYRIQFFEEKKKIFDRGKK